MAKNSFVAEVTFNLKSIVDITLWQTLKELKQGIQQAMAGLDNVTADITVMLL